jgi:hypothetical protein
MGLEGAKNLPQGANKTGGYETDNRTLQHFRFSQRCCLGFKFLRDGRSGDRIPVGARISAPVQTGPGAYPASYTTGAGSLPGVKRPGRGVDHPPTSSAEVKERVQLHFYSPPGISRPVLGRTLPLQCFERSRWLLQGQAVSVGPLNWVQEGCRMQPCKWAGK